MIELSFFLFAVLVASSLGYLFVSRPLKDLSVKEYQHMLEQSGEAQTRGSNTDSSPEEMTPLAGAEAGAKDDTNTAANAADGDHSLISADQAPKEEAGEQEAGEEESREEKATEENQANAGDRHSE